MPVLRLQAPDKTEEPEVQGKAQGKIRLYQIRSAAGPDRKTEIVNTLGRCWRPGKGVFEAFQDDAHR